MNTMSKNTLLPVADPSVLSTCTVISLGDGLLRIITISTDPPFSSTLYSDWLKFTVATITINLSSASTYSSIYTAMRDTGLFSVKLILFGHHNDCIYFTDHAMSNYIY